MFKKYLILCLCSVLLTGCNFLDFDESSSVTQDQAYGYFANITKLATSAYRELPEDWGVISDALRESATDNAIYTWDTNSIYNIYDNIWSPSSTIDDEWSDLYAVIRDINSFLDLYNEETLSRYQYTDGFEDSMEQSLMYLNEVRALRAVYYFELIKRYGDVPLVTTVLTQEEANEICQTPFADIVDYIVTECDAVMDLLPIDYSNFVGGETGRITKYALMGLKSRVLLYAASPLHNSDDDTSLYEAAADAAYDIIDLGVFSMVSLDSDPLYDGANEFLNSKQLIFERRSGNESNDYESRNMPISLEGAEGGNTPSQNLVDAFEFSDGTTFDWDNPDHVRQMYTYDDGTPSRDPRLYYKVIHNGASFMNSTIQTYVGGTDGSPIAGATLSGYYLKSWMNEGVSLSATTPVTKKHHYPMFRYGETLLNYAEAMNEWKDPSYTDDNHPISALTAVNIIRTAAGMPEITETTQDTFRERLRNERRVELAFEDHRFWDIRRWKIGDVVKDIYGVEITVSGGTTSYKKKLIQTRIWNDKMYLYPISNAEIFINSNLVQNSGW